MKHLPIGKQDFKELIEEGYLYVDKTRYIYDLASLSTPYFFSRPRRFGKSLTISKLDYLFKGEKELFKDTWIYDRWDWKPHPVIRLSMSHLDARDVKTLEEGLVIQVNKIATRESIEIPYTNPKYAFSELIEQIATKKGKVVVLIDEYDKPMLDHLHHPEKANLIREALREFYGILKDHDAHIRFLLLTGITKFTKAGVFSTLNNLNELTTDERYGEMFGYTQQELEASFSAYIDLAAEHLQLPRQKLLEQIRQYYNGFSFDGVHLVYNPFSILNFFDKFRFDNYWLQSGSPSFLVEYARKHQINADALVHQYIDRDDLTTFEIEKAPPAIFLVQSGYLTFKSFSRQFGFLLDYPNKEVRDAFSRLIMMGSYHLEASQTKTIKDHLIMALRDDDFEGIFQQWKKVFANIPYTLYQKAPEGFFHAVILTTLWTAGIDVKAEEMTYLGRSDLVMEHQERVYILELKKDAPEVSLEQIRKKGYPEKYQGKNITLVGIEIDEEGRNLKGYTIANP